MPSLKLVGTLPIAAEFCPEQPSVACFAAMCHKTCTCTHNVMHVLTLLGTALKSSATLTSLWKWCSFIFFKKGMLVTLAVMFEVSMRASSNTATTFTTYVSSQPQFFWMPTNLRGLFAVLFYQLHLPCFLFQILKNFFANFWTSLGAFVSVVNGGVPY